MDPPWRHIFYIGLYREIMKTSSCLKQPPRFLSILAEIILIMVQMVLVRCISRSLGLKIDFHFFKNLLV